MWGVILGLRQIRVLMLAVAALFVTYTALRAFQSALDQSNFPESLAIKVEEYPVVFVIHMVTGGLALALIPLAIAMRYSLFHKWFGRVAAADVLVAGVTAIPVAWYAPVTAYSGAGFIAQAITWMTLLALGIWNIRRGSVKAHQACMLMMAAVTSGAMFFRIYLALWAIYGVHRYWRAFYSLDAWIAWLIPLAVMATVLFMKKGRTKRPSHNVIVQA